MLTNKLTYVNIAFKRVLRGTCIASLFVSGLLSQANFMAFIRLLMTQIKQMWSSGHKGEHPPDQQHPPDNRASMN
jgi:hypothetical protein